MKRLHIVVLAVVLADGSTAAAEPCPTVSECKVIERSGATEIECAPGDDSVVRMTLMVRRGTEPFTKIAMERAGSCSFKVFAPLAADSEYYAIGIDAAKGLVFETPRTRTYEPMRTDAPTPPISPGRVVGELFAGGAIGLVGGLVGGFVIGVAICQAADCSGGDGYAAIGAFFAGAYLGSVLTFHSA